MMKITFEGEQEALHGLQLFESEQGLSFGTGGDYVLRAVKGESDGFQALLQGRSITIRYRGLSRFFRAWSYVWEALQQGKSELSVEENSLFKTLSVMLDVSRNAVLTVDSLTWMFRRMALMGVNSVMLYTEDTYEVDGKPYFGYMRGRYSHEELRFLDAYALGLGIELIPCIQTLGHLRTYLRWNETVHDTPNVLLAGAPETYAFIEELFKTVKKCFHTDRIHIGMDETFDLGRGSYCDRFGLHRQDEIYFDHLSRVAALAEQYSLKPMIWSDMFFRLSGKGIENYGDFDKRVVLKPEIVQKMPANVQPVFWDYYHKEEDFYAVNLQKHDAFAQKAVFAGGVWSWSSYALQFSRTVDNTVPALEACKKHGTQEVIATLWYSGESGMVMALAGVQLYAEYAFSGVYDQEKVARGFYRSCHASFEDFLASEAVECPTQNWAYTGVTRGLMHNDILCGLADAHIKPYDMRTYYHDLAPQMKALAERNGVFNGWLTVLYRLTLYLEYKADFGVRLKEAYDRGDKTALAAYARECDEMLSRLESLRKAHREAWMQWNKPFGWEVLDIRYGGMANRIDTAKYRLLAYCEGRVARLEELEQDRLRIDGSDESTPANFIWSISMPFEKTVSVNLL